MLNMGFVDDVETILNAGGAQNIQTLLFSATLPSWVKDIQKRFLKADFKLVDLVGNEKQKVSPVCLCFNQARTARYSSVADMPSAFRPLLDSEAFSSQQEESSRTACLHLNFCTPSIPVVSISSKVHLSDKNVQHERVEPEASSAKRWGVVCRRQHQCSIWLCRVTGASGRPWPQTVSAPTGPQGGPSSSQTPRRMPTNWPAPWKPLVPEHCMETSLRVSARSGSFLWSFYQS